VCSAQRWKITFDTLLFSFAFIFDSRPYGAVAREVDDQVVFRVAG
jgi:hypothetical protein